MLNIPKEIRDASATKWRGINSSCRPVRWIGVLAGVAIFWFASAPAYADPITYTINFTTIAGSLAPTSGSFTFNSTTPAFSAFTVSWHGGVFDLTASANAPLNNGLPTGCTGESQTPSYGFSIMTQALVGCSSAITYFWVARGAPGSFSFIAQELSAFGQPANFIGAFSSTPINSSDPASGTWSVTPVPEPSSLLLLGTGLIGLTGRLLRRKKHG